VTDLYIAGVDEAGRGPLAGDVYAAAVILNPNFPIAGLTDSKKLSAKRREMFAAQIKQGALAWCIAHATVAEIDQLNILQATLLAMQRAIEGLSISPAEAWIDGNRAPNLVIPTRTVIKGDLSEPAISAASILAKTARDASLAHLHATYPDYGFAQHKGYGTALHLEKLTLLGPCPAHRRSFAPVRQCLSAVQRLP
jgi:ribonuclease HII